jgi:hypothetical protein
MTEFADGIKLRVLTVITTVAHEELYILYDGV